MVLYQPGYFEKKALMAIYGSKKDLILCPTSDNDEDDDNVDEMKTLLNNVYPEITEVQRSADKTA